MSGPRSVSVSDASPGHQPRWGPGRPVVLIGPPTAGKSSVGALLAAALGVPFADTDTLVAQAARKPVGDIFVDDGELVFREFERGAVARGLDAVRAEGGVLALGSGAVLDPDVRRMLAGPVIVYLETEFATVAKRTGMDRPRVVIPGNPRGRLRAMLEERRPVYAELAVITTATDDLAPEETAASLAKRLRMSEREVPGPGPVRIPVGGDQPYEVVVGSGVLGELPGLVGKRAETVAVFADERLSELGGQVAGVLHDAGYRVPVTTVPSGEAAKDVSVLTRLWSGLAGQKVTRTDCVVAVGGGATTDLIGFTAATWLRGVRVVLLPTTLLGMVDAAVGGKTAIDIPEGKNLVGAFYPPAGVLADLATLHSLPRADYVAGLAEVIKHGFIADGEILRLVDADPAAAASPQGPRTREVIERAIAVKARVVSADLREAGLREMLNYGHTLGHAIEKLERYAFRHGDAVAIGMVFAAEAGQLAGYLTEADVRRHRDILAAVGLPVTYPAGAWPALRETMSLDKKTRGARLRMVVLDGIGHPVIYDSPPEDLLAQAYRAVAA